METGVKHEEIFVEHEQPFETIFRLNTLHELKNHLRDISFSAMQAVNNMYGKKSRKIIQDVKEYIDENFSDTDLTLSDVAKKFYINLSYLSRTFKEEIGLTFVDYLRKIRMEKAIKLVNQDDKKVYQIAEEIGIKDPHYFSVCFKKYTGMSINSYKKSKML
jgi:two-component system response regulator YesN